MKITVKHQKEAGGWGGGMATLFIIHGPTTSFVQLIGSLFIEMASLDNMGMFSLTIMMLLILTELFLFNRRINELGLSRQRLKIMSPFQFVHHPETCRINEVYILHAQIDVSSWLISEARSFKSDLNV